MFILTPPERKKAIMPVILQIPQILYPRMQWLLLATIIFMLVITLIVMPKYKSRQNFNLLIGKPVGTEILIKVEREGEICYCISKRGKSLIEGLK